MTTLKTAQGNSRLISLPEVSRIICLKKTAIYQLIAAGELRPVKLGKKTVFSEAEVQEWVIAKLNSREN